MCGIAGILKLNGGKADRTQLATMIATLHHRGPDAWGAHASGKAGLAHARLSIIDLKSGAQPMSTIDERLWIPLNGEIFSYFELCDELMAKGHVFVTLSNNE